MRFFSGRFGWFGEIREREEPLFWRVSSDGASGVMREGKWKFHEAGRKQPAELYDLSVDPSETNNLAGTYPEVVAEMQAKLEPWQAGLPETYEKKKATSKRKKKDK